MSIPTEDRDERTEVRTNSKVIRNVAFLLNRNTGKAKIVTMFEIDVGSRSDVVDELTDAMMRYIDSRYALTKDHSDEEGRSDEQ